MTKLRKASATKRAAQDLRKLEPEEKAEVIAELSGKAAEAVKNKPEVLSPGMIGPGGLKVAYSRKDLDRIYGICGFVPEETLPVTVHGVRYQLITGVPMMCPTIIRDTYLRHREILRTAAAGKFDTGFETQIDLGAGALPPE